MAAAQGSVVIGVVAGAALWAVVCLALAARVHGRNEPLAEDANYRWRGRPVLAGLVVGIAHLVPLAAAVGSSTLLARRLPPPSGAAATAGFWLLLLGLSTAVLLLVDRLARRLLPLAALYRLSLLFPDRAPSRLAVARQAGSVTSLRHRLEHARENGIADEPARAAETILALVGALRAHDRFTRGHSERVRALTDLIADELKLRPDDRDRLRWAALLHDIGKLETSPDLLNKPGRLDPDEWAVIHRHPEDGARLAAPLTAWLGAWAATIEQHHERWDGSGYPKGLRGTQICMGARIVAVADAFEVMTAARAYKKPMKTALARQELTRYADSQFDPDIVRAFVNISIGPVRWGVGPVSWLVQLPLVGWVPRVIDGAAMAGGHAMGVVGAAAGVAVVTASAGLGVGTTSALDASDQAASTLPEVTTVVTRVAPRPARARSTVVRPPATTVPTQATAPTVNSGASTSSSASSTPPTSATSVTCDKDSGGGKSTELAAAPIATTSNDIVGRGRAERIDGGLAVGSIDGINPATASATGRSGATATAAEETSGDCDKGQGPTKSSAE